MPFSSAWKWSGVTLNGGGQSTSYVMGAPDILVGAGALQLTPELQAVLEEHTAAGRRVVAFGEATGSLPTDPSSQPPPHLTPRALVVLEERLRPDAAETIEFMREQQVDLKLISGDARSTVTAVAYAIGVDREAGVIEGPQLPDDRAGLGRAAEENTIFCRITPEQKKALVSALGDRGRFTAMIGDGVNDVPALKQARHGGGDGLRKPDHQGRRGHRPAEGPVLDAAPRGGRGPADRPQHPPPRAPLPDEVGLRRRC